jgi:histidinol-phosphate aminotransferase
MQHDIDNVSRRGFLKGALLGSAALAWGDRLALAEQMAGEQAITIKDIDSAGLPPGMIRMSSNENPLGPSPKAMEAVEKHMWSANRYAWYEEDARGRLQRLDPELELIRALAKVDGIELPDGFDPDDETNPFFLAPGSGRILKLLAIAYLSQGGGETIEAEVAYGDISEEAEVFNEAGMPTNIIRVPMTKDHRHDLDAMLKAITPKTTLLVITNPNNPTGTLLSYQALEQFVSAVPKDVVVIIDEAYVHFVDDPNYRSAISLATANDNVIVIRTFSKVYGIRGILLGYAVTSPTIKKKLALYNSGRASAIAQIAGAAALGDLDHVQKSRQIVLDSKARLVKAFDEMGLEYIPSQSSFMMVNVKRDARTIRNEMWKQRVSISNRGSAEMPGWLRISAGTMEETEVFIQTLKRVLEKSS